MAMIYCKECGKEISDKADKCPHCGCPVQQGFQNMNQNNMAGQSAPPFSPVQNMQNTPRRDPFEKDKNSGLGIAALILSILGCTFWLAIVLAIIDLCKRNGRKKTCSIIALIISGLWLTIGVSNIANSDKPKKVENARDTVIETDNNSEEVPIEDSEPTKSEDENKEMAFKKGETAELNGVQVTLTDYKESTGSEYNKPTDGNVFLMTEFEISNNTEKELTVSSVMSFDAYADDYALNFSFSALLEKEGNQLDGAIASGKKMKGWIGWEVPQDYQNVEIHFTDSVWSNNKFVFLIEK